MSPAQAEKLLKWYPSRWRARYGEELVALIEDTYGEEEVPRSTRLSIVRAGIFERFRELGFGGGDGSVDEQVRSGSLLVLLAWSVFVVAGAAFAKMTEHWDLAAPRAGRGLPSVAFASVQWAAVTGAVVVLLAAIIALPAFAKHVSEGGWAKLRRPIMRAAIVSTSTVILTAGMVAWAHHYRHASSNGGWVTHLVGTIWALLVVATIGTCTLAAISTTRKMQFSPRVLRLEGLFALCLTLAMVAIIGGTIVWAVAIARDAPSILSGSGLFGLPGPPAEIVTGLLMVAGLIMAIGGSNRVAGAISELRPR